jgi:hypothetical protein
MFSSRKQASAPIFEADPNDDDDLEEVHETSHAVVLRACGVKYGTLSILTDLSSNLGGYSESVDAENWALDWQRRGFGKTHFGFVPLMPLRWEPWLVSRLRCFSSGKIATAIKATMK